MELLPLYIMISVIALAMVGLFAVIRSIRDRINEQRIREHLQGIVKDVKQFVKMTHESTLEEIAELIKENSPSQIPMSDLNYRFEEIKSKLNELREVVKNSENGNLNLDSQFEKHLNKLEFKIKSYIDEMKGIIKSPQASNEGGG